MWQNQQLYVSPRNAHFRVTFKEVEDGHFSLTQRSVCLQEALGSLPISSELQQDAYAVRHRQHTETFHASRWDSHMAGRMSRQLAEGATGIAAGTPHVC